MEGMRIRTWVGRHLREHLRNFLTTLKEVVFILTLTAIIAIVLYLWQRDLLAPVPHAKVADIYRTNVILVQASNRSNADAIPADVAPTMQSKTGHLAIVGAINPWQPMVNALLQQETKDSEIIVYGTSDATTTEVAGFLKRLGFHRISVLYNEDIIAGH
jgi:hypothetical protein